jgi:glucose uptake protein
MLCWGSWANTQKLCDRSWRFELFYWDYVWGILLFSFLSAFTMGSMGEQGRRFLTDINQATLENIGSAVLGGIIFNAANILLIGAIAVAGMAVAFPVAIGIALVLGVLLNYLTFPIGNPQVLFLGVALVTIAILLDARAYKGLTAATKGVSTKGLTLSVISGIMMATFYQFVARSMSGNFEMLEPGKLGPYGAVFIFTLGIFFSNFLFNTILMKKPIQGNPVTLRDYLNGSMKSHMMGILGGVIWNIGMTFSIIASGQAGFAISYGLGQGATMVAALWGVYVWKEFKDAPQGTSTLITAMFVCYFFGLVAIVISRFV